MRLRIHSVVRDVSAEVLFRAGISRPERFGRGKLTIVTFHRVLPAALLAQYPIPEIVVTPEELAWFARFFREHFTCLPLSAAVSRFDAQSADGPAGEERPLLTVTFDDGQVDNFVHARPVLAQAGLRATFFAVARAATDGQPLWHDRVAFLIARGLKTCPDEVSAALEPLGVLGAAATPVDAGDTRARVAKTLAALKKLPTDEANSWVHAFEARISIRDAGEASWRPAWDGMMTGSQLRALAAAGHEIGSHSQSHAILTGCSDKRLVEEAAGSKAALEALIGAPVTSFCYPNGDHDDRVIAAVRRAGYQTGVTTRWGLNDHRTPRLVLRRCDIQSATARSSHGALSASRLSWRLSGLHPGLR